MKSICGNVCGLARPLSTLVCVLQFLVCERLTVAASAPLCSAKNKARRHGETWASSARRCESSEEKKSKQGHERSKTNRPNGWSVWEALSLSGRVALPCRVCKQARVGCTCSSLLGKLRATTQNRGKRGWRGGACRKRAGALRASLKSRMSLFRCFFTLLALRLQLRNKSDRRQWNRDTMHGKEQVGRGPEVSRTLCHKPFSTE